MIRYERYKKAATSGPLFRIAGCSSRSQLTSRQQTHNLRNLKRSDRASQIKLIDAANVTTLI